MTPDIDRSGGAIELVLQSLQHQRSMCVARLTALLEQADSSSEVENCLARIDTINATLIRVASAQITH